MWGGCKYSEAGESLQKISQVHQIPLVETHAGKSTVSWEFENNLGGLGILGTSAANKAVQQADLIIELARVIRILPLHQKVFLILNNQNDKY